MISYDRYPLPPNWEMKYDFAAKKYFYVNHKTKSTTWEDPRKEIFNKDDLNANFINRSDFVEDNADINSIIKVLNEDDNIEKFVKNLKGKYPTISSDTIKEVYKKSKGNSSNAEVLLRQETRKETGSILSNSTINYGTSYESKCQDNMESRFNLSERSKYKAPETSKDRIKFQLRSEFSDLDIRIVDRVLEITNYSLEESRKSLSKTKSEQIGTLEDFNLRHNSEQNERQSSRKNVEMKATPTKTESNIIGNFKHFVSRRSNTVPDEMPENGIANNNNRKSLATGADPKNFKGSHKKNLK